MAVSIIDNKQTTLCGVCLEVDPTYFALERSGSDDACPCNCGIKLTWVGDSSFTRLEKVLSSVDAGLLNFGSTGLNLASVTWTNTQGGSTYNASRTYAIYKNGILMAISEYAIPSGFLGVTSAPSNFNATDILTLIGI